MWDLRTPGKPVMDMNDCEEYISDMLVGRNKNVMIATRYVG